MLSASNLAVALERKSIRPEDLESFGKRIRNEGKTLATINGSFDLLHPGHIEMLYQAADQADILLVLLNSDASIRAYKNPKRPINSLEDRLKLIASLEMVDYVSFFEETDPVVVLDRIQPHVHVNGSEYGENCIEAETVRRHGGKIHIVSIVDGYSSTHLIQKIQNLCD